MNTLDSPGWSRLFWWLIVNSARCRHADARVGRKPAYRCEGVIGLNDIAPEGGSLLSGAVLEGLTQERERHGRDRPGRRPYRPSRLGWNLPW